jgi:hypothetical protein
MIVPAFVAGFHKTEGEESIGKQFFVSFCLMLIAFEFIKGIELLKYFSTSFARVSSELCVYSLMSDDLLV